MCELKEIQIIDVLDRSNISHALFHTVVEKNVFKYRCSVYAIGADSTGATGNFAPVLTQEPRKTLRFAPVPFVAVL